MFFFVSNFINILPFLLNTVTSLNITLSLNTITFNSIILTDDRKTFYTLQNVLNYENAIFYNLNLGRNENRIAVYTGN